jgi:hypothetical protein
VLKAFPTSSQLGFTKFKAAFDEKCGVTDWTLNDLRRTSRSPG